MKNVFKVFGIIAFAAVMGFSAAACATDSGSGDNDTPLVYSDVVDGKVVEITISRTDPSKAVLTPRAGDYYVIKYDGVVISKGTVTNIASGGQATFRPSADSPGPRNDFTGTFGEGSLNIPSIPREGGNLAVNATPDGGTVPGNNGGTGGGGGGGTPTLTIDDYLKDIVPEEDDWGDRIVKVYNLDPDLMEEIIAVFSKGKQLVVDKNTRDWDLDQVVFRYVELVELKSGTSYWPGFIQYSVSDSTEITEYIDCGDEPEIGATIVQPWDEGDMTIEYLGQEGPPLLVFSDKNLPVVLDDDQSFFFGRWMHPGYYRLSIAGASGCRYLHISAGKDGAQSIPMFSNWEQPNIIKITGTIPSYIPDSPEEPIFISQQMDVLTATQFTEGAMQTASGWGDGEYPENWWEAEDDGQPKTYALVVWKGWENGVGDQDGGQWSDNPTPWTEKGKFYIVVETRPAKDPSKTGAKCTYSADGVNPTPVDIQSGVTILEGAKFIWLTDYMGG